MTEIRFYHLQKQTLDQALPLILEKALKNGFHALVRMVDNKEVERMNEHLWTYRPHSFLPHSTEKESAKNKSAPEDQPVWITAQNDNSNNADLLVLTQNQTEDDLSGYKLCCEMLDGRHQESVEAARARWKIYQDQGHEGTYWHQNENGAWKKKA